MTSSASALAPKHPAPALSELLTATVAAVPGVLLAYGPGAALRPARREALLATAALSAGAPGAAWCHRGWAELLGATLDDQLDAIAALGEPDDRGHLHLDGDNVLEVLGEDALAVVEAAVALGQLAGAFEAAVRRLARPRWPVLGPRALPRALRTLGDVAVVSGALPFALAHLAAGATAHLVNRTVPAVPVAELVDEEPNLLAHLLATATPAYLSHAVARGVVLRLPVAIVLGVQAGPQSATVRVADGAVRIANGIADDVLAVLESDGRLLAAAGLGALARELRRPPR